MQYQDLLPSQHYIPVVTSYTCGSALGAIKAVAGLNTNQGRIQSFDADGNILVIGSGTLQVGSGYFYGFQLEVTKTDAQANGWPGNESDVTFGGHSQSSFVYSV